MVLTVLQWRRHWTVVAMVAVLMVARLKPSTQLRKSHPLHDVVDEVNARGGPYVGLLIAFPLEEAALVDSGEFVPSSLFPCVQLAGRRFNIGTIRGVNVISVMSGEQIINAGITTQILYDAFDVVGVVHYGIAGSSNDSILVGDVAIPSRVAFTSSWDWQEIGSSDEGTTTLNVGAFNLPEKGENLLGDIEFTPVQLFSSHSKMKELFWLPIDSNWFKLATQIKVTDQVLQRCINNGTQHYCLPEAPKAAFGVRGSTADVYLNNAAYRGFLWEKLNVSSVDEESAAVVMTSLSNGKPCVVFRGISDYAEGTGARALALKSMALSLAATNALNLAVEFIELIGSYKDVVQDH